MTFPRAAARLGGLATITLGLALILTSAPQQAHAACECGYLDPVTNVLWTDATITYFNETGLQDMVTQPEESPKIYGHQTAGETGTGQQSWAVVGDHVNDWEESFGATYRSAVSYNNTFIDDQAQGLAMQVSPANLKHRIVNGSQIVTRRRDILYGSFRAQILPPTSLGRGAAFKFGASYNLSETVDLGIFTSNEPQNSTLQWSYSAAGHDSNPVKTNLTWLDTTGFVEHRIDWLGDKLIQFRNNAPNVTVNLFSLEKKVNASNIPTTAAPVSFQFWANGEPSQSQGPPIINPLVTRIMYTRFFFNSSRTERLDEFDQQCQAAGGAAVCSTDDNTLRDSTQFDLAALNKVKPAKLKDEYPIWAIVLLTVSGATFIMVIAHGLVVRKIKANKKKELAAAEAEQKSKELAEKEASSLEASSTYDSNYSMIAPHSENNSGASTPISLRNGAHPFEKPFSLWASPDLVYDSDSDTDSDDDDDDARSYNSVEDGPPRHALPTHSHSFGSDLTHKRHGSGFSGTDTPHWVENVQHTLPYVAPGFASSRDTSLLMHSASANKLGSDMDEIELMSDNPHIRSPAGSSIMHERLLSRRNSEWGMSFQHEGSSRRNSEILVASGSDAHLPWQGPQIIQWKQRDLNAADGEVGQLAKPAMGDSEAAARKSRDVRPDINPNVQPTYAVWMDRIRDALFIKGTTATTSTGARRIDYLDGMRGFAAFLVSFHHFMLIYYYGITTPSAPKHYETFETWYRYLIGALTVNQGFKLGIFFVLPARTMCNRYLLRGGLQGMADTTVRRLPRLGLPVAGAVLANYFFMDVGAFKWVPRLASRTWSTWSYWQNFDNVMVFVNAFISLWWAAPPLSPALVTGYATGVLWTIPVIVQGTWTSLICVLIAHEIKNPIKRFGFYACCVSLSWYANTWDLFFMAGLIIADLDAKINYQVKAAKGFPLIPRKLGSMLGLPEKSSSKRVHGQVFAWILFLACCVREWMVMISTSPIGNFDQTEYRLHPDWQTSEPNAWVGKTESYTDPRVGSWVLVMAVFAITDLNNGFRAFFRLKIWSYLGKHAFAVFLCHGVVFWSWGAWLCLAMLKAGAPYWLTILVVFLTSYSLLMLFCEFFTRTFDHWGGLFCKAVWRATSGGLGRK